MFFTLRNVTFPTVYMAGVVIECVKEFKFLGCVVDHNMFWSAHINFKSKKIA